MILLKNINFFYGDTQILKNITFDIPAGEVTTILGPSGSGKTTLLRILTGLLKPASGEIWMCGKSLMTLPKLEQQHLRNKMAIVFQNGALFDSLTVWENIAFPLYERFSMPLLVIRQEVDKFLELFGLQNAADLAINQCSGGMQMRVAIARAFACHPEIILYDEPTSGLDPIARDRICDCIQKQQFQHNVTSVLVTHQLSTAFRVSKRFICLYDGEILFDGTANELTASKNPYVQRFIQPSKRVYRSLDTDVM